VEQIELAWALRAIEDLAAFGKDARGVTRLSFSDADRRAREYVIGLMKECGLSVRIDEAGNVIGRLDGRDPLLRPVATGSHLDTVIQAGKYDGVLGIVGGLLAARRLAVRGITHPLEVIVFAAEEPGRFNIEAMGSKAMAGLANMTAWLREKDLSGISFAEVLAQAGLDIKNIAAAARHKGDIAGFVELNIEQGAILEQEQKEIGIVEELAGRIRMKMVIEGLAAHAGTTPMHKRFDALVSAAMIILAIEEIGVEQSDLGTVATVGNLRVLPGGLVTVPGRVEMFVDIRGTDQDSIIETVQEIKDAVSTIADGQETPVSIDVVYSEHPTRMDDAIIKAAENACQRLGRPYVRMPSGAGGTALNMTRLGPAGLLLIPCRNGLSHNPDE